MPTSMESQLKIIVLHEARPGSTEKDQLEKELHAGACDGNLPLADAQHRIASNWVECWGQHVAPGYGPEWTAENHHGW